MTSRLRGAEALIFDMRGNGGGYLDAAIPRLARSRLSAAAALLISNGELLPVWREELMRSCSARASARPSPWRRRRKMCRSTPWKTSPPDNARTTAGRPWWWGYQPAERDTPSSSLHWPTAARWGCPLRSILPGKRASLIGTGLTLDEEIALSEEEAARQAVGTLPASEDAQLQAALIRLAS